MDINKHLEDATNVQTEKIIKDLIESHDTREMLEGVKYYRVKNNKILSRKQYFYKDGVKTEDTTKPNNKIPHGWHKLLVDQKTSYIVGQPIVFSGKDEKFVKLVNDTLGEDWDDAATELVKNASNKGIEWLHPYINAEGEFDYVVIPAEEFIPIWDSSKQKTLVGGLRYYSIEVNGKERFKAEWWDTEQVTYYIQDDNGHYKLDDTEETNPAPHFQEGNDLVGYEGRGWGKVPFIPFRNNTEEMGDLQFYKELIDAYDFSISDIQNNLDEIQDLIYILKGYDGENLSEFMENLRHYKAIKVSEDGGVDTKTAELPLESTDIHLKRMERNIFMFGQGVDMTNDKFGNSPTGVALQFIYALLDLKSNMLELKFRKGLRQLVWFIAEYLRLVGKGDFDYKSIEFTFNHSMIFNESEQIENALNSGARISRKTATANHPWVDNVDEEEKRIADEETRRIEEYEDDLEGDGDET